MVFQAVHGFILQRRTPEERGIWAYLHILFEDRRAFGENVICPLTRAYIDVLTCHEHVPGLLTVSQCHVASGWRNTLNISAHPYTAPLSLTHPVPKFPNVQNAQILVLTLKSCYQIHHTWHMHKIWELYFCKINHQTNSKVLSTRHNKASPLAHLSTNFPPKIKFQMQRKPKDNTQKRNCFYLQFWGAKREE
jgi:hypothetical protein